MPELKHSLLLKYGLLLLFSGLLIFSGLKNYGLRDKTELVFAGVAAEMSLSGEYLLPQLNNQPLLDVRPLYPWVEVVSMKWLGINSLAARLPSAIVTLVMVFFLMWWLLRQGQAASTSLIASLLLISTGSFLGHSREAGPEALLTFGVALSLLSFYQATRPDTGKGYWLLFALGLSIATLSKSILGLVIPVSVLLSYLMLGAILFDKRLIVGNWLRPVAFILIGLIPLGIWSFFLIQWV